MFCGSRPILYGGRGGKMDRLIVKVAYPWSGVSYAEGDKLGRIEAPFLIIQISNSFYNSGH